MGENWTTKRRSVSKSETGEFIYKDYIFYDEIWSDGNYYMSPDDILDNKDTSYLEHFLTANHISNNVFSDEYDNALSAFKSYIEGPYTEMYNQYYIESCQMDCKKAEATIAGFEQDLLVLDSFDYTLRQRKKEIPYNNIANTDEYKKYWEMHSNDGTIDTFLAENAASNLDLL